MRIDIHFLISYTLWLLVFLVIIAVMILQ